MTLMWSFAIILILSLFHGTTCSITEDNNDEKGTTAGIEIIDGPNLNTSVIKGIMFHVSQYLKSFFVYASVDENVLMRNTILLSS